MTVLSQPQHSSNHTAPSPTVATDPPAGIRAMTRRVSGSTRVTDLWPISQIEPKPATGARQRPTRRAPVAASVFGSRRTSVPAHGSVVHVASRVLAIPGSHSSRTRGGETRFACGSSRRRSRIPAGPVTRPRVGTETTSACSWPAARPTARPGIRIVAVRSLSRGSIRSTTSRPSSATQTAPAPTASSNVVALPVSERTVACPRFGWMRTT